MKDKPVYEFDYVAGFLFSRDAGAVALVEKKQPDWQRNKLNAVGGKIEEGETPKQAMVREFEEEAGLEIQEWKPFTVLTGEAPDGKHWRVCFFRVFTNRIFKLQKSRPQYIHRDPTSDIEGVYRFDVDDVIVKTTAMPNLSWLIPMAINMDNEGANGKPAVVFQIKELYSYDQIAHLYL